MQVSVRETIYMADLAKTKRIIDAGYLRPQMKPNNNTYSKQQATTSQEW